MGEPSEKKAPKPEAAGKIRFLLFALFFVALWYAGKFARIDFDFIEIYLRRLSLLYSGAVFIVLYVVLTFFVFFSKDFLRLVAALVFGAYWSTVFVYIAETVNAVILFSLARTLGRDYVAKTIGARHKGLDSKLGQMSFPWLFIIRFTPLIPFRFQDLSAGLTKMSLGRYLLAIILASPLRLFWVQYALAGVGRRMFSEPSVVTRYFIENKPFFALSMVFVGLIVIVLVKIGRTRRA